MLRTHWIVSSSAAKSYFAKTDYYASASGEWLGKGAQLLELDKLPVQDAFHQLCDNIDPRSGELLRPQAREDGRVGMDLTFNSVKSVGIAREMAGKDNAGDPQIEEAHRDAVRYAMGFVEDDMQCRVRVGGADHDRVTGNMVAYRVTHRDTRISAEDQRPDMSLHDHVFVLNTTYDAVEGKWKAAQMGQIKHDAPYYEAIYHNRLASNLKDLGYGIKRDGKAFEINGISRELVEKFSRRREYIKGVAAKLGITSQAGMDKLGATTRLGKAKELADDLNGYYVSRLTGKERQGLEGLIGKASYESTEKDAVGFAIAHLFERKSVVDERRLYEAAIRQGIGSVTPEGVHEEATRQGVLRKNGEATTRDVLAEEGRIIAFARDGRGTCRPMGVGDGLSPTQLSHEQAAIARHVWDSPDRVIMIRGAAGTGKTHTMEAAIAGIGKPVVVLAPSADASRGVLRKEGFEEADTVARFLMDEKFQEQAKGGVIWVDEAGLLGIRQVRQVFDAADRLGARVVLQGDRRQHGSVERGATLRVLEQFAGLPVAELQDIRRQKGKYKSAVKALSKGDIRGGYGTLTELGWVKQTPEIDHNKPLVDDYLNALDANKSVLVVAPTHAEGDEITAEIRLKLKERGLVGADDKILEAMDSLNWTEAEKGDLERYDGSEIMQFHRNSGTFKAGDRVLATGWKRGDSYKSAAHFSVYKKKRLAVAAGDTIRITANGKTLDDKHKLNNGAVYMIKGFDKDDNLILSNGWTVGKDFGHLTHGYVTTSHASQGKTVDRVLIAMGSESLPAINAEQFYVSVSRGKEQATVYTDMTPALLGDAIQKSDKRKSATELVGSKLPQSSRLTQMIAFMAKIRRTANALRERAAGAIEGLKQEERGRAR